jgi:hypothetical protein
MKTALLRTTSLLAAVAALVSATPASAALLDRGPQDPTLVFPLWYRALDGTAVGMCTSQAQSPNLLAGLKPMCFPATTNPAGFPGNLGPELFYNDLTVTVGKGGGTAGFTLKYLAALEASYIPAGFPAHGTEAVFARIRVIIATNVPGTYKVTHPFGVNVFTNVGTGPRAVFFTVDVPFGTPLNFDAALGGPIGPFIKWDFLNAGESLTVGAQTFLGDPNYAHTYTGSPFGTNFVRVDGPVGSNLDGAGNDFILEPLGVVVGQIWSAPIATAFNITKAVYSRSATLNTMDVWATSAPAQKLILTGVGMPSVQMKEYPGGNYYSHLEESSLLVPPASVTVTNLSSNPVVAKSAQLVDGLDATATYASATGAIAVAATSSDLVAHTMSVLGPFGGLMTPGAAAGSYTFAGTVPLTAEPPQTLDIASSAGGTYPANVVVLSGAPMNAAGLPVAVNDAPVVAGAGSTTFDVSLNDTFAGVPTVLILTQPLTGTATAAATGGLVTYTPLPGASGLDSFTYALQDAVGVSNVATVSLNVPFVPPAPAANADNFAMLQGTSRTYAVLANDVAGTGTAINPASVVIVTPPAHGTAIANVDGTVTYTPVVGFNSALDTFAYTVANTLGTVSAPATVTVDVFGGPEAVSIGKALFTVSKTKWTIVGSTNWFGAALTQTTATCWLGTAAASTATTFIGTAPVDTTGKFSVVPVGTGPVPPNPSVVTCQTSNGGVKSGSVTFQ